MKRNLLLIAMCGLLSACAPQNQMGILNNSASEITKEAAPCDDIHGSAEKFIDCLNEAERKVLVQENFEYADLLNAKDENLIETAKKFDEHKINRNEMLDLDKRIDNQFMSNVVRRDSYRQQRYVQGLNAIAAGLNSAPTYTPTYSYAPPPVMASPSAPPIDTMSGPMINSLQNNYVNETNQPKQPSPIDKLRDCAPNGSCEGVFAQ